MDTVILITFKIPGFDAIPTQIASVYEPSKEQIMEKLVNLAKDFQIEGTIRFKKLLQEKGQKMYIYFIDDHKCVVFVEKLEKVIEF
ncbi:hypothetical protein [Bacillus massilinigeriensis]|uniref:hypothetical protein n=1 Tax=Bacillus mediterraneensis TaxID=1805474 RepID=UPI0008F94733|nr:hypothetical protein [Bacillus mediterraneensis]